MDSKLKSFITVVNDFNKSQKKKALDMALLKSNLFTLEKLTTHTLAEKEF